MPPGGQERGHEALGDRDEGVLGIPSPSKNPEMPGVGIRSGMGDFLP